MPTDEWPTNTSLSDNAAMPTPPVHRVDPYKNFKFRLKFEGRPVAGASNVSGLPTSPRAPAPTPGHGLGQNLGQNLGRNIEKFEPITLERGLTQDTAFQTWATTGGRTGTKPPHKPIPQEFVLEEYNEAGRKLLAWKLHRCQPSIFQSTPDLDGKANSRLIEILVLENEGWERDLS